MVHYNQNERYIKYLCHFHYDHDFFECHEVLEEQWKLELNNEYKKVWLGLIRLAVVLYHYRRGNYAGAKKLMRHVQAYANDPTLTKMAGLDHDTFKEIVNNLQSDINDHKQYKHFHLPIKDQKLYQQLIKQKNNYSTFTEDLIHKHSTRDRSDVISERKKQLEIRKNQ